MENETKIITFSLVLDTGLIQNEMGLIGWCVRLEIPTVSVAGRPIVLPPTWEMVFAKIARIIVGSTEYKSYCRTGILDSITYSKYLVNDSVGLEDYPEKPKVVATRARRRTPASSKQKVS